MRRFGELNSATHATSTRPRLGLKAQNPRCERGRFGNAFASPGRMVTRASRVESALGWWLAASVHPVAAWRRHSTPLRVAVVLGYLLAGYTLTGAALIAVK